MAALKEQLSTEVRARRLVVVNGAGEERIDEGTRGEGLIVVQGGDPQRRVGVRDTASTTAAVTGYEILRATSEAGPYSLIGTVTGRTVETYTDTPLSFATTYHYVMRSIKENWRSVETVPVSRTTRSSNCL